LNSIPLAPAGLSLTDLADIADFVQAVSRTLRGNVISRSLIAQRKHRFAGIFILETANQRNALSSRS
jgi:hypothetical protein